MANKTLKDDISAMFPGFFEPDGWKLYGGRIATMGDGAPVIDSGGGLIDLRTLKPYEPNVRVVPDGQGRFKIKDVQIGPVQVQPNTIGPVQVSPGPQIGVPRVVPSPEIVPGSVKASPGPKVGPPVIEGIGNPDPAAEAARAKLANIASVGQILVGQGNQATASAAAQVDAGMGGGVDKFLEIG